LNLLQSVSPVTLSFSPSVKAAASALYEHSLQYADVSKGSTTLAIHMRFGDVSSRAPTPLLWKKWSTLAHGDAKVAFVGTDANQREREEIKKVFPSALIGCPLDVIPQCGGTMVFAIEQTAMSMYTYFGGFWPSSYSANVATHRLLLGHSIYSMMAFGDQPVAMVDLKPFQRMDTGFGILTAPLTHWQYQEGI